MKKTILIFGVTGLLGSQLNLYFKKKYKIFGIGKNKNDCDYNFDVNNRKKTENILKKIKPDIVINCIAYTDVDKCNSELGTAFKKNVLSVFNLFESIKKINHNIHLIHISTDQVYNDLNKKNIETNINILNNYGLTKYMGEKQIKNYKKFTILRTNFFCKSIAGKKLSYTDWIQNNLIQNRIIKIPNNVFFNPIHVNFLSSILEKIITKKIFGIYNLGSKDGTSKYLFAKKVAKKLQLNSKKIIGFKSLEKIHLKPQGTIMDVTKIEKKMRIKMPKLRESLELIY